MNREGMEDRKKKKVQTICSATQVTIDEKDENSSSSHKTDGEHTQQQLRDDWIKPVSMCDLNIAPYTLQR
jgi:hypothetical protein